MQHQGFKCKKNGSTNSSGQRTVMKIVMMTVVVDAFRAESELRINRGAILGVRQVLTPPMAMSKWQNRN